MYVVPVLPMASTPMTATAMHIDIIIFHARI